MDEFVTCQIWWARPEPEFTGLIGLLDVDERDRHARFHFPEDQLRYVVGRALLRIVLADRLGAPAESLHISTRCRHCGCANGKPRLADRPGPSFSVSHSGDRVVLAVTDEVEVGVDVEQIGEQVDDRMFEHALSPTERGRIADVPPADRLPGFFVTWTRKEAVLKAMGYGLTVPPAALELSAPSHPPRLLRWANSPPLSSPVLLRDLHPGQGYSASLALLTDRPCRVDELDARQLLVAALHRARCSPDTSAARRQT